MGFRFFDNLKFFFFSVHSKRSLLLAISLNTYKNLVSISAVKVTLSGYLLAILAVKQQNIQDVKYDINVEKRKKKDNI